MNRIVFLLGILLLAAASPSQAQIMPIPSEGIVLNGGQRLRYWTGGRVLIGRSPRGGSSAISNMRSLLSKPSRGTLRLERNRRHYRDKELSNRQAGTLGKGVLTELLYKKGRKHSEKSKARSKQGKGSKSALKSMFKGLFK